MRRRGFSLLEVLISLGLLGLVLTVVIGLFLSSYSVAASSTSMTVAGQLGANELARLKALPFATLQGQVGGPPTSRKVTQNAVEYDLSSVVKALQSTTGVAADADMLQLQVTVSWKDTAVLDERGLDARQRKTHEVHLESQVGMEARY